MNPMNANETSYERFEILGRDALFTDLRIDRKTLPEGLYAYDLRRPTAFAIKQKRVRF